MKIAISLTVSLLCLAATAIGSVQYMYFSSISYLNGCWSNEVAVSLCFQVMSGAQVCSITGPHGYLYLPYSDLSTPRQFIMHILSTKYQAEIYRAEFCFTDCSHDWQCPAGQRCDEDQGVCFDGSFYYEFLCQIGKYPIKKLFFGI